MGEALAFTVSREELQALGTLAPAPLGSISPFRVPRGETVPALDPGLPPRLGLLGPSGELTVAARHALQVLGGARSYARVYVTEASQTFEQTVFFDPEGGVPVGVTNTLQGLRVEDPAPLPALLEGIRQLTGETPVKSSAFKALCAPEEALALAAALDLERRRRLASMASLAEAPAVPLTPALLARTVRETPLSTQWLTFAVRSIYRDRFALDEAKAAAAAESLSRGSHFKPVPGGFALSEPAEALAALSLVFERILHVEAGRALSDGQVVYVGFSCLQAGVQDLLYVERTPEGLHFEALSSASALELTRHLLAHPEALDSLAAAVEAEKAAAGAREPATMVIASENLPVLRLRGEAGVLEGQTLVLGDGAVIGRQAGVSVVLDDARVSRRHAEVRRSVDGRWTLSDLGSSNGTFVNDQRISVPTPLGPEDRIRVAETILKVLP